MKKTIKTVVMTFDELPDEKAKNKARDWWREGGLDGADAWDNTYEDAENIGLKLTGCSVSGSVCHNMEGEFIISAIECYNKVTDEHGPDCDTYKAAQAFDAAIDKLPEPESEEYRTDDYDAIEADFLAELLKCYARMYSKEIDYRESDEYIDETILANEYTFTADGKRFG